MQNIITMRGADDSIVKLEYYDRLGSAAELARQYAKEGYSDRYAVITAKETSRPDDEGGIYMSLILRPSFFPSQAGLLSSLATVALLTALDEHTTKRLGIGWVSNIYCEGKHIGGVTIEGKLDNFTSYEYIIVNFSVKLSKENFPPRLTDLVKKVFESDNNSVTTIIAKSIINKFLPLYTTMKTSKKFMNTYTQRFILSGTRAKHVNEGKKTKCKVIGIDPVDCALLVEMRDKQTRRVTSQTGVILPKTVKLPKK